MTTNLFSSYRQGENRVTATFMAVLQRLSLPNIDRILGALLGETDFSLVTFINQPRGKDSTPDAKIQTRQSVWIETKAELNKVDLNQVKRHLESVRDGETLLLLTPDDDKPEDLPDGVIWSNFRTLSGAVEEILDDEDAPPSEKEAFLLREFNSMLWAEGLISPTSVLVVAASGAWSVYEKYSVYTCQPNRSFRPSNHISFYADREIKYLLPRIKSVIEVIDMNLREQIESLEVTFAPASKIKWGSASGNSSSRCAPPAPRSFCAPPLTESPTSAPPAASTPSTPSRERSNAPSPSRPASTATARADLSKDFASNSVLCLTLLNQIRLSIARIRCHFPPPTDPTHSYMKHALPIATAFAATLLTATAATNDAKNATERTIDFDKEIRPILESACIHCHGPEEDKGDLRMHEEKLVLREGDNGPILKPGDSHNSSLYWTTDLPEDDDLIMPPKGDPLTQRQKDLLKTWVEEGAHWPKGAVLTEVPRMSFKNNIKPLLEKGGPFDDRQLLMLRLWSEQGAVWDEGVAFRVVGEEDAPADDGAGGDDNVTAIHSFISETSTEKDPSGMAEYTSVIPGLKAEYTMIPIPGGEFTMGSPDSEANRGDDEGPQVKIKIEPFWMGKHEVTWDEYLHFMLPEDPRNKDGSLANPKPDATIVDLVSRPTEPYQDMSFGMGQDGYPAICMTQHAANKFCEWLSAKTGHFYRLPTEAEWEYACRAGTTTAYSFGDDAKKLDDYAWYFLNSNYQYQKIGEKKPNPWSLYDMHGNVLEWTVDFYLPNAYEKHGDGTPLNPWTRSEAPYPHTARGGSWDDDPEALRSAARRSSNENWKMQDPQLPKSIWYHTDAVWLGMRVVRPLKVPSVDEMREVWYNGVEFD